uniref:histidine--tRNA ligase n=1 Tax=Fundulus heteroclitus TaxID=8078 RepID=A0A146UP78_FUNHE
MSEGCAEKGSVTLKTPKGTRDYSREWLRLRCRVIDCVRECCLAHDAEELDTPCFELRDLLSNKYGEDQKLIYHLEDFDGELLSLRYDLTVPFARYLGANRMVGGMRRFQVGKVYRRDNPKMNRGRMREFFQCDFDIAGRNAGPMVADAEVLLVAVRVLDKLRLPSYVIKLNHRKVLQGVLMECGVEQRQIRTVCSSIDKLDKRDWSEVRSELVSQKDIPEAIADRIGQYVTTNRTLDALRADPSLQKSKQVSEGLVEIDALLSHLESFRVRERVVFDCALARGLDYYTGVIYEAVLTGVEEGSVGTVAAGGRYDGLVGKIAGGGLNVPCVGISFGIERIVTVLEERMRLFPALFRPVETEVYVASAQSGFLSQRLGLVRTLLDAGLSVGYSGKQRAKFLDQVQYCENNHIPFCLVIGQSEVEDGVVKLREVETRTESVIKRDCLVEEMKRLVADFHHRQAQQIEKNGFPLLTASRPQ